ncbi:hypothetical protein Efla_003146 [Eimeria flavescens]
MQRRLCCREERLQGPPALQPGGLSLPLRCTQQQHRQQQQLHQQQLHQQQLQEQQQRGGQVSVCVCAAQLQQQQEDAARVSPHDVTRLLQSLAAVEGPRISGGLLAAAEAAAAHAAANKQAYTRRQQKAVAEALLQLGLKPQGLDVWLERWHGSYKSNEIVELVAGGEENAEVYIQLDDDNPAVQLRRKGKSGFDLQSH